jgi:hypothetical protein
MKKIILFLMFLSTISCVNNSHDNYPNINIATSVIRSYDTYYHDSIKMKTYDIKLSIINRSNYPIAFWIMSCSWEDDFIINNDYVYFKGRNCNANFPWIRHLNPNDSLILTPTVWESYTEYQPVKTTKFGLIYIDSAKYKHGQDFNEIIMDKSKYDHIIWSDPLYLSAPK